MAQNDQVTSLYLLAATLFLLTADVWFIPSPVGKIKIAYFLVLLMALLSRKSYLPHSLTLLKRTPKILFFLGFLLSIAIFSSVDFKQSAAWFAWLLFDLFTLCTFYSFLKYARASEETVHVSSLLALGAMGLMGLVQFLSIYAWHQPLFSPQIHEGLFRINGVSGWPHFLNIFAFLILPLALMKRMFSLGALMALAVLIFSLVQSTAKTGWLLFIALGFMFLFFQRGVLKERYLKILLPLVILFALVPTPSDQESGSVNGVQKARLVAHDLEITPVSSGRDRILINQMGIRVGSRHLLFGIGPRAYSTYVNEKFDQELTGTPKTDVLGRTNTRNENIWVELFAETGLIFTLILAFVLLSFLWKQLLNRRNRTQWACACALFLYYAISGQFSQNILLTLTFAIWGIFFYAQEFEATS